MNNKKELIDLKKRYYGNNSNNINNNISNSISYSAFSLVEISISLIVIAVILAALSPVITKRLTSTSTQKNKISTNCSSYFPQAMGYCAMCYVNPKRCIICTRSCNGDEFKNVDSCICESCRTKYGDSRCSRCNSKRCLQCDQGYYLDSSNKCVICPRGYYCYQDNSGGVDQGVSVKKPCPKGYAAPNEGMSACVACNKSTNTIQGSVAINEGSVNCTLCSNGYYASTQGQTTSCNICPKGYYCPSGKIIECPKGTANNQTGRYTVCASCVKSTSTITGTYAISTKQTLCSSCTNGNYASVDKQSSYCNTCPGGYYCPSGKIIKCPVGTYSTGGAVSCIACPSGSYSSTQGASTCIKCSAGYYSLSGKSSCSICPQGTYSTQGASSCITCPSGYYSNQGAASCTKCSTKYPNCKTCNNTQCIECETGYKLSDNKQKCEKKNCPKKTVKVTTSSGDLCVTQYNMGDQSEFPLSGVSVVSTNSYCNGYSACCWRGGVTSNLNVCNADNGGYSGCRRPVCTHSAAQIVCANLKYDNRKWRLPTKDELAAFPSYSQYKSSSGLMLCDNSAYHGAAVCNCSGHACQGASDNDCSPRFIWSSTIVNNMPCSLSLLDGSIELACFRTKNWAHSVRCVSEL